MHCAVYRRGVELATFHAIEEKRQRPELTERRKQYIFLGYRVGLEGVAYPQVCGCLVKSITEKVSCASATGRLRTSKRQAGRINDHFCGQSVIYSILGL